MTTRRSATPQIKVCGVTDTAFARHAASRGVDYVGLIFAEGSPRRIPPQAAAEIVRALEGRAKSVGVFTATPVDAILALAAQISLDVVQLHSSAYGDSDTARLNAHGLEVWRLLRGAPSASLPVADAVLLDGVADGRCGGTGTRADWSQAERLATSGVRVVLAGGISAENIREAAATGCAVLDANSSLETAPGVKSAERLDRLLAALRG